MRWMVVTALLLSGVPALAQLQNDPENAEPVHPDPPPVLQNVIPPSEVNADQAVVVPATSAAKPKDAACSDTNPCATPTPESR